MTERFSLRYLKEKKKKNNFETNRAGIHCCRGLNSILDRWCWKQETHQGKRENPPQAKGGPLASEYIQQALSYRRKQICCVYLYLSIILYIVKQREREKESRVKCWIQSPRKCIIDYWVTNSFIRPIIHACAFNVHKSDI